MLAFYIGGMGAKDMNFHKLVFARMGFEREAVQIQDLFFDGRRDEAIAAVPRSMVSDISLVGSVAQVRDELAQWEEAGVTMLVVGGGTVESMRQLAEVVLQA
jgi:alkanesulfonate monooxygenase SsuD/methylene tetrahydromethanopterin reductase-like flavin-dependent oxidoreductase (luciferase family)